MDSIVPAAKATGGMLNPCGALTRRGGPACLRRLLLDNRLGRYRVSGNEMKNTGQHVPEPQGQIRYSCCTTSHFQSS